MRMVESSRGGGEAERGWQAPAWATQAVGARSWLLVNWSHANYLQGPPGPL